MHYQPLLDDPNQIEHLYRANQWTNYTNDMDNLLHGINQSLYCYAAYDHNKLVGLIRVVGDNHTIVYIQDILILPEYHRQGIGTMLVQHILDRYSHVRQILLTTDQTVPQQAFYESLGFVQYDTLGVVGFYYPSKQK